MKRKAIDNIEIGLWNVFYMRASKQFNTTTYIETYTNVFKYLNSCIFPYANKYSDWRKRREKLYSLLTNVFYNINNMVTKTPEGAFYYLSDIYNISFFRNELYIICTYLDKFCLMHNIPFLPRSLKLIIFFNYSSLFKNYIIGARAVMNVCALLPQKYDNKISWGDNLIRDCFNL